MPVQMLADDMTHVTPRAPALKRKRAECFDHITLESKSGVVVRANSGSTTDASCSRTSTPHTTQHVIHVRDESDIQVENEKDRRCLLRELGVPESFPISLAMEIPSEYFWNDQHPADCSCHWCNVLFGMRSISCKIENSCTDLDHDDI